MAAPAHAAQLPGAGAGKGAGKGSGDGGAGAGDVMSASADEHWLQAFLAGDATAASTPTSPRSLSSGKTTQSDQDFEHGTVEALASQIAIIDAGGRILWVNKAWRDFALENGGSPESTGVGVNYLAVVDHACGDSSDEAHAVAAGIRAVMRRELDSFGLEYPCHSPTEKRWFLCGVTRYPGHESHVVIAHSNITARKLKELAVSVENKELKTALAQQSIDFAAHRAKAVMADILLTSTADLVQIVQHTGTVVFASCGLRTVLGYETEDWVGRSLLERVHIEDVPAVLDGLRKALVAGSFVTTFRVRHKNGAFVVLECSGRRVKSKEDPNQDPLVVCLCRQVREEGAVAPKLAVNAVSAVGAGAASTVTAALSPNAQVAPQSTDTGSGLVTVSESVIIMAADAKQDFPIMFCNEAFERMTGLTRDEVIGNGFSVLQGLLTDPVAMQRLRGALEALQAINLDILCYRKDGSPFWNRVVVSPQMNTHGACTGLIGVLADVSAEYVARAHAAAAAAAARAPAVDGGVPATVASAPAAVPAASAAAPGTAPAVLLSPAAAGVAVAADAAAAASDAQAGAAAADLWVTDRPLDEVVPPGMVAPAFPSMLDAAQMQQMAGLVADPISPFFLEMLQESGFNEVGVKPRRRTRYAKKWQEGISCDACHATSSPEWRKGPEGSVLCNACGLKFSRASGSTRIKGKRLRDESGASAAAASAAAAAAGASVGSSFDAGSSSGGSGGSVIGGGGAGSSGGSDSVGAGGACPAVRCPSSESRSMSASPPLPNAQHGAGAVAHALPTIAAAGLQHSGTPATRAGAAAPSSHAVPPGGAAAPALRRE